MSIRLNLKIFLFAIIFYFTKQIELYVIFMIFALLHEIGHLICGVCMGLKPKSLRIMPLGISIEFKVAPIAYNQKVKNGNLLTIKKLWIALAGPLTNIIITILAVYFQESLPTRIREEIIYANLLIAIFNLLPIYPLDGGRILHSMVHLIKGKKFANDMTNRAANWILIGLTAIASIAIYYYQNIAIVLIILYLWGIVILENKRYTLKKRMEKIIENS